VTIPSRLAASYGRIREQQQEIDRLVAAGDASLEKRAERISRWTVGQQLEHLAIVNLQVDQTMARALSEAPSAGRRLSVAGWAALGLGWIPRGVGKAPEASRPAGATPAELRAKVAAAAQAIAGWSGQLAAFAACATRRRHPKFGRLTPVEWIRFVEIHNHHHLKIVRDIRQSRG